MSGERLTINKKRRGRPPRYLTQEQLENPTGDVPTKERPGNRLSILDIVQGELSKSRIKYAADLASRTEAAADETAVKRVEKRLERVRKKMLKIEGIDRLP